MHDDFDIWKRIGAEKPVSSPKILEEALTDLVTRAYKAGRQDGLAEAAEQTRLLMEE